MLLFYSVKITNLYYCFFFLHFFLTLAMATVWRNAAKTTSWKIILHSSTTVHDPGYTTWSSKIFNFPNWPAGNHRPYPSAFLTVIFAQVIYPHTKEEMLKRGRSDKDLKKHLDRVQLSYLLNRDDGWDTVADWIDVLSGGEKQRIAVRFCYCLNFNYHHWSPLLEICWSAANLVPIHSWL